MYVMASFLNSTWSAKIIILSRLLNIVIYRATTNKTTQNIVKTQYINLNGILKNIQITQKAAGQGGDQEQKYRKQI